MTVNNLECVGKRKEKCHETFHASKAPLRENYRMMFKDRESERKEVDTLTLFQYTQNVSERDQDGS